MYITDTINKEKHVGTTIIKSILLLLNVQLNNTYSSNTKGSNSIQMFTTCLSIVQAKTKTLLKSQGL